MVDNRRGVSLVLSHTKKNLARERKTCNLDKGLQHLGELQEVDTMRQRFTQMSRFATTFKFIPYGLEKKTSQETYAQ